MTFQAKNETVYNTQLAVQEVSIKLGSPIISVTSGAAITLDFQEPIASVTSSLFIDDSAGTVAPVTAANTVVSGTTVKLTLSAALAANDSVVVRYSTTY